MTKFEKYVYNRVQEFFDMNSYPFKNEYPYVRSNYIIPLDKTLYWFEFNGTMIGPFKFEVLKQSFDKPVVKRKIKLSDSFETAVRFSFCWLYPHDDIIIYSTMPDKDVRRLVKEACRVFIEHHNSIPFERMKVCPTKSMRLSLAISAYRSGDYASYSEHLRDYFLSLSKDKMLKCFSKSKSSLFHFKED